MVKLIAWRCLCQLEDSICNTTSSRSNWYVNEAIPETFLIVKMKVKNIKIKDTKMGKTVKRKNMKGKMMRTKTRTRVTLARTVFGVFNLRLPKLQRR
jgi:hypothetical protein